MFIAVSKGIVKYSSRDCWDEGILRSSGNGVEGVAKALSMGVIKDSCSGESRYPDEVRVSMTSGAPSIESRRIGVEEVVVTVCGRLSELVVVTIAPGLPLVMPSAGAATT